MIRRPPRSTRTDNSFPTRRSSDLAFVRLTEASTNYVALGEAGFAALTWLVRETPAFGVTYPDSAAGIALVEQLWDEAAKRSEEHTSELQSLMRSSYAVFCLKKKTQSKTNPHAPNESTNNNT